MITQSTTPMTSIAVLRSRKGSGANSCLSQPNQSESTGRASANVVAMELFRWRTFDDCDRGCAHAEKILVWTFDLDAYREALRDPHPVQFALHVWHSGR